MNINEQIKIIEEIRTLLDENGIIPAKWHHKLIDEFIETKVKNNVDLADVSGMLKCVSCDNTSKNEGFDCYGKCHICTQAF